MAFKLNNPTENTENLTKEELRDRRMELRQALDAERKRVENIRSNIDEVAEAAVAGKYDIDYGSGYDGRANIPGAGVVPQKTFEWLDSMGGAGCSTYACGIMREAGVTVPNSVGPEGITINNVTYKPGDKMPIIPGNEQFDAVAPMLGFELRPPGSLPEEGDVTRVGYGYGATSHSTIQTGEGQNVYNPGLPSLGLKESSYYAEPSEFAGISEEETQQLLRDAEEYDYPTKPRVSKDKKIYPTRLMQYVGDLPALQQQYRKAAQAAPYEPVLAIKPKPVQLGPSVPTATLPANMLKFFNRNK
jgi:hypothetical protein